MNKPISIKNLYVFTMFLILVITLFSPFLVRNISFIDERYTEFILLFSLMILAYFINKLYNKQSNYYEKIITDINYSKNIIEERLNDAFRYIGKINVQMREIDAAFNKINKYPESKQEIKNYLKYLTEKIFGMIKADWIVFRIVDVVKLQTLTEVYLFRDEVPEVNPNISNKSLVNKDTLPNLTIISSTEDKFTLNSYCVFPAMVKREEKIFIESIINQAEMLYIIYSSIYLKKKNSAN